MIASAGFASYGISCTTLEEVFLSIARGGVGGSSANRSRNARLSTDRKGRLSTDDSESRLGDEEGENADERSFADTSAAKPLMDDDHDAVADCSTGFRAVMRSERFLKARRAEDKRAKMTAFMGALHARLGQGSSAALLAATEAGHDVVRSVLWPLYSGFA